MEATAIEPQKRFKTFKKHLIEDFACSYCLGVLNTPVMTVCDHLFCKNCLVNYMEKCNECPICKGEIDEASNLPVPNVINNVLNKLKEMLDDRFPYNQKLELRCAAEMIDLVDESTESQLGPTDQPQNRSTSETAEGLSDEVRWHQTF